MGEGREDGGERWRRGGRGRKGGGRGRKGGERWEKEEGKGEREEEWGMGVGFHTLFGNNKCTLKKNFGKNGIIALATDNWQAWLAMAEHDESNRVSIGDSQYMHTTCSLLAHNIMQLICLFEHKELWVEIKKIIIYVEKM